jgi:hypothetical protein
MQNNNVVIRQRLDNIKCEFNEVSYELGKPCVPSVEKSNGGFDVSKVDPIIREAAEDPFLRITLQDCSDLARQLDRLRNKASY